MLRKKIYTSMCLFILASCFITTYATYFCACVKHYVIKLTFEKDVFSGQKKKRSFIVNHLIFTPKFSTIVFIYLKKS